MNVCVCNSFVSERTKGFCVLAGQLPSWLAILTLLCCGKDLHILLIDFNSFLWSSSKFKSCNFYQVHHGGAGTTAAGLKAAVTNCASSLRTFFVIISLSLFLCFCLVSDNNCTVLWRSAILGREGACQRSRTCTHPSWWILSWKAGWCHTLYARPSGIHHFCLLPESKRTMIWTSKDEFLFVFFYYCFEFGSPT